MTQEEKQLLLKDLCARLPYEVQCHIKYTHNLSGWTDEGDVILTGFRQNEFTKETEPLFCNPDGNPKIVFPIDAVKPYLRPMSSMTNEELMEFGRLKYQDDENWEIVEMWVVKYDFLNIKCRNKHDDSTWVSQISRTEPLRSWKGIDWLIKNHFDYRGLIEKGLALDAPKDMYKMR